MATVGIIAEYNPFHNGHKLHIEKAKEITGADKAIVVMSGNFVQRGEPAVFDKWSRAKCALLNGADIVIELPVYFSTASAEYFAKGAVDILNKTGCVDYICFGSESGNIEEIKKAASCLVNESDPFKANHKAALDEGLTYPAARSKALKESEGIDESLLNSPNNILAVEYVKALMLTNSNITPVTIKRMYNEYNSTEAVGSVVSATAIRAILSTGADVTKYVPTPLKDTPVFADAMGKYVSFKIRTLGKDGLTSIVDVNEGLENRIFEAGGQYTENPLLVSAIKSKRYTHSRIQRILLHIMLDIRKAEFEEIINSGFNHHIRLLGFRKDAQDLVSKLSKGASVPVVTTVKSREAVSPMGKAMLEKESQATDIYYLLKNETKLNADLSTPMVLI